MPFDSDALPIPDLGLRCPTCGYILAGLPERRCPECGLAFRMDDLLPPGDFPVVIFDGRQVSFTQEIADLLRRHRIPCMEIDAPSQRMLGLSFATRPGKLGVLRGAYFEAIDLLRRQSRGELPPEPQQDEPQDWSCPACGEENPGTFDLCWKCETPRDTPA